MNARDKLFDTVAHSMATSEEFPEQEARRLIDAVVAEVRAEAADFLSEIGTPITGERTEHERGVMYASERLRAMVAPASAPVESAGDETGEAPHCLKPNAERAVVKAAVANALDGHRDDADLATRITDEVISNLTEARGGDR